MKTRSYYLVEYNGGLSTCSRPIPKGVARCYLRQVGVDGDPGEVPPGDYPIRGGGVMTRKHIRVRRWIRILHPDT